jgi:hypothetical protein
MKKSFMKHYGTSQYKWLAVFCCLVYGIGQMSASSPPSGTLPPVTVEDGTLPFNNNTTYREAFITWKGKAKYFLMTGNNTAYTNSETVYVTFDGTNGSVSPTSSGGDTEFECTVILLQDTNGDTEFEFTNEISSRFGPGLNNGIFVDSGTYFLNTVYYASIAPENTTLIGLNPPGSPNPTIIKQKPVLKRSGTNISHYLQRQNIYDNTILMNLVFDADHYGMVYKNCLNNTNYSHQYTRDSKDVESNITWGGWSENRGDCFFYTSAGTAALMRNVVIKNIGAGDSGGMFNFDKVPNYAINILANTQGQINIENVTI